MPDRKALSHSHRMALLLMIGAFVGKVTGLVRELLLARTFGTTPVADSFRGSISAILIPISPLQNEGVPGVLVPLYREWAAEGRAPQSFGALCIGLLIVSLAIMTGTVFFVHPWMQALLGGLDPSTQRTAVLFATVMAFAMPGSVVLNCLAAAEIATGRSRVTSLRPTLLNLSIMAAVLGYLATGRLELLPLGYCLALNGLAVWITIALAREGIIAFDGISARGLWSCLATFFVRLRPFLALPLFDQMQVFIERRISSSIAGGTIAAIDYARTLTDTAVLLVSQPLGLALLHSGSEGDGRAQMAVVSRRVLAFTLPAALVLLALAPDIVRIFFARGAFTEADVEITTQAVRGIAVGLWATVLAWILIRILNNTGRNSAAIRILCAAYAINAAVDVAALLAPAGYGLLVIGLGEAVRGVFLLVAIAACIGWLKELLLVLLRAVPITGAIGFALLQGMAHIPHASLRLLFGAVVGAAGSAALLWLLDRDQFRGACEIAMTRGRLLLAKREDLRT